MIRTREDLRYYLQADRIALKRKPLTLMTKLKELFFPDHIWDFQKLLRKVEYLNSKRKGSIVGNLYFYYKYYQFKRLSVKLGFSIPMNVFGPGLAIVHIGTIVVNPACKIGANCRIHVCTNIGTSSGDSRAPILGDNIYIGPGAKIYGNIKLASNIAIAANAAVNKSFEEENKMIGGIPAKIIGEIDVKKIIKHLDSPLMPC